MPTTPITEIGPKGLALILHFECGGKPENYLKAYQDSVGIWTIGVGTIRYPNGIKVKAGDTATLPQVMEWFKHDLDRFEKAVDAMMRNDLEQHQFDALVAFAYNLGENSLRTSTLRKRIEENLLHPGITEAFLMWNKANGKISKGIVRRRQAEAWLFTKNELKFTFE